MATLCVGAACDGPPAEARALWFSRADDLGEGGRLGVYDRGELREIELRAEEGATLRDTQVGLSASGRFALLRGARELVAVDLEDGRRLRMRVPPFQLAQRDPVQIAGGGAALFWFAQGRLRLVPLAPAVPLELDAEGRTLPLEVDFAPLRAGDPPPEPRWAVAAAEADLLVVFTARGAQGRLHLLRFPGLEAGADASLELVAVSELTPLLPAPGQPSRVCVERLDDCGVTTVIDPSGEALTVAQGGALWQWRWGEGPEVGPLELPAALSAAGEPGTLRAGLRLAGAPDHRTLWLFDGTPGAPAVRRWRPGDAEVWTAPALGEAPYVWASASRGRALTLVSLGGPALRVGEEDFEVLNTARTPCSAVASRLPVFAPEGRHVAWVCREGPRAFDDASLVVRVAPGQLEARIGIPFVALAIDDRGNLLLYSEAALSESPEVAGVEVVPRTLYVLGEDEVLRRADDLDPTPLPTRVFGSQSSVSYLQGAPVTVD